MNEDRSGGYTPPVFETSKITPAMRGKIPGMKMGGKASRVCAALFLATFTAFVCPAQELPFPGAGGYNIIITTPGYTSVYRYRTEDFCSGVRRDLRVFDADVTHRDSMGRKIVDVTLCGRKSSFEVSEGIPVIRFAYDRNRRIFSPLGMNCREVSAGDSLSAEMVCTPVLPGGWSPELARRLVGHLGMNVDGEVLIMDAEVDENGIVRQITEVGGAPRQASQVVIEYLYEMAARGWKPLPAPTGKKALVPLVVKM